MSYRKRKARVMDAERRLEQRLSDAHAHQQVIGRTLKRSFTPMRLMLAGVASGVLMGWLGPLRNAGALASLARSATGFPALFVAVAPWLKVAQAVLDVSGQDANPSAKPRGD